MVVCVASDDVGANAGMAGRCDSVSMYSRWLFMTVVAIA